MSKTFEQGRDEVAKLCHYFDTNRGAFLAPGVKEAHVRQTLIDPLFEALGWDVRNTAMAAPQYREVVPEDSLEVDGHQQAPDYAFRVGTIPKFFAEAKKCGINIGSDQAPAYQLRSYGWSAKVGLSILTDFEELAIYDCTFRPRPSDKAGYARIQYLRFEEYADKWHEIWDVFSREAVWSGAFDKYAASKRKRGTTEVDQEFLKEIEEWREALARNIALRNDGLGFEDLSSAVQRTIDRVVFLRMAEDRGLEPYGQLLKISERDNVYHEFIVHLCRKADEKYNSGLFHFRKESGTSDAPDALTPGLSVDDKVFRKILQGLYFEHGSPYRFRVLGVEILGTIYERFLAKVIRLTAQHQAKIEEKPEVRKAGGVYYTPSYIVDHIVKSTIGRLVGKESPSQLAGNKSAGTFRVLDMACGSGSFLLGAYQWLLDHCLRWYAEHKPESNKKAVYADASGQWHLTIAERKRILTTHIFGVDIDPQAVEVTKLSLLLKALEGENDSSLSRQMMLFHERALPNLSENVKCGNSLVEPAYFSNRLIPDAEELKIMSPFDWKKEFPTALGEGGFSVVIGNPPYLNVDDTWGKGDPRLEALSTLYPHIYNDKTDLLFYFLGRAVQLCKGTIGFIVSRAFLEAYKADKLRDFLSRSTTVTEIVDFQNYYVFTGIGITTCILTMSKEKLRGTSWAYRLRAPELPSKNLAELLGDSVVFEKVKIEQKTLGSSPWVIRSQDVAALNSKIDQAGELLGKILVIGQGMQTGRNDIFGMRTREEIEKWGLSPGQYFKRASNSDIQQYFIRDRKEYILFPHAFRTFDELPKGAKKHLSDNTQALKGRAAFRRGDCEWWLFTWPLHSDLYGRMRILCPYLATTNRFAMDERGEFLSLTDTTVLFENGQSEKMDYLLGLLNSKLLTFRFRSIGKLKSAGIYEYFWNSVSRLSIRRIDFKDESDLATHDRVVMIVRQLVDLSRRVDASQGKSRELLKGQIGQAKQELDGLIYTLYGLSKEEVALVEREVPPDLSAE